MDGNGGYNSALRRGNMFDGRTTLCGRGGKCCCCSLSAAGCRCLTLHVAARKEIGNSLIHQLHAALCPRTLLTRLVALPSQWSSARLLHLPSFFCSIVLMRMAHMAIRDAPCGLFPSQPSSRPQFSQAQMVSIRQMVVGYSVTCALLSRLFAQKNIKGRRQTVDQSVLHMLQVCFESVR